MNDSTAHSTGADGKKMGRSLPSSQMEAFKSTDRVGSKQDHQQATSRAPVMPTQRNQSR